jgi:shikimate dehydrogenase
MKKYIVIGNPIDHSLSPKLHNYWIKKNKLNCIYEKKQLNESHLKNIIEDVRIGNIDGINVTTPFKNKIITFLDELTSDAKQTQSVNTIYKEKDKVFGHNTDASGFELALRRINYSVKNKTVFILGAGGVVPSVILALKRMKASKIILSNRTKEKAKKFEMLFQNIEVLDWGKIPDFNMIINATSLGLKNNDEIKLDYSKIENNKFFYDIIYNPKKTKFLSKAEQLGNQIENGKMMFLYQAHQSFTIWHKIMPSIDEETINFLDK